MTRHKNNIVMIKRRTSKRVQLPNGRVFYAKYMRTSRNALLPNLTFKRTHTGNPVQRGRKRQPPRVRSKPAHVIRRTGFGKIFSFVKKCCQNLINQKNWKGSAQRTSKCL